MKPHNMFNTDDRAVSPVIGVILMVAITVILAAVIGTFVLGLGDSLGDSQPSAQLDVSYDADNGNLTLEHAGGDRIESETLEVVVTNPSGSERVSGEIGSALSVGDAVEANFGGSGSISEIRVRVIHQPSDSILVDRTAELTTDVSVDNDPITFSTA